MLNYVQQNATESTLLRLNTVQRRVYSPRGFGDHGAMTAESLALTAIRAQSPTVDEAVVARAVGEQFGLHGEYTPLVSERDQNFRLRATDGGQFLVKVTSAVEDAATTDFQIAALQHIENAGGIPVPGVVRTVDGNSTGELHGQDMTYPLRVMTWVDGEQLESLRVDAALASQFGTALARLNRALWGYSHPGEKPVLLWDLQRVVELRALMGSIADPAVRTNVAGAIDDYENNVVPALSMLRTQVIHGDANPENVLITDSGFGFIDFGDIIKAPLVFDVAIAASYMRAFDGEPMALIAAFLEGYHSELRLESTEGELLFDLIRARLATTITLMYWRIRARPQNDPYRQKTLALESGAGKFLAALDSLGRAIFNSNISKLLT